MINSQSDIGHGANLDGINTVDLFNNHSLLHLANTEDGGLWLVDDDGRCHQTATDAVIGEGKGAALYLGLKIQSITEKG